ncbi:MAG TPA: NlpC/P60 family protein [Streptosporangiaceae bacterium]|nr:NlpC/P60 family protein [Streptosporangiaceae bacterium]
MTTVLPSGVATAEPRPSAAEARKKLEKLNEQVDQLVEKFNKLRDGQTLAKRRLTAKNRQVKAERATFDQLRQRVAEMAATAYKTGDMNSVSTLISANDPQAVLDQVSVFTQMSTNRANQLTAFLAAAQRLQREQGQAKSAYDELTEKAKQLARQKAQIEKAIAKQKKLLGLVGGVTSGGAIGGTYTGPASGSARTALNYAYAQLGKPYCYGGAGPSCFDCSGLTMKAWGAAGVGLPHNAAAQYNATPRVAFADLRPGDLVFMKGLGHMGMFVGGGKMMHAPHTGTVVKIVDITSGYYRQNFLSGGRP